jgi:hypothetical protein
MLPPEVERLSLRVIEPEVEVKSAVPPAILIARLCVMDPPAVIVRLEAPLMLPSVRSAEP